MTKATILVVEDEPNLLMMGIKDVLLEADYNVLTATNAEEAIEQLNQHTPDIVVMEIHIVLRPDVYLLQYICEQEQWATIPIIALIGKVHKTPRSMWDYVHLPHNTWIFKPFDAEELTVEIEYRLKKRQG